MNSMTGFGKAEATFKYGKFSVELSSVNSRFLEISVRLPRGMASLEAGARDLMTKTISRGKVNVWVGFDEADTAPGRFLINEAAIKAYHAQLVTLAKKLRLESDISMSDMMLLPEIAAESKESIDVNTYWPPLAKALSQALKQFVTMRIQEGASMKAEMTGNLRQTEKSLKEVVALSGNALTKKREKLEARIGELLTNTQKESLRIEEEIAIIADRVDISEECSRLFSHIKQFRASLSAKEPIGKKLNFILQEMNREANTIASKASDFDISSAVISIKEEVEKMREMVQNVE